MVTCPTCRRESPPEFAFCPACGAQLAPVKKDAAAKTTSAGAKPPAAQPALAEERKVVTTLFCDLVGFTTHSEISDHELIDGLLQQYTALARGLVEEHGGTVEKFIGDAVLAVFGFPHAHEDDAERAVRCGLRLAREAGTLTWPDGDRAQVRIGVNSGEIYLHAEVDPTSGRTFLTGDAVNAAARLEAAAPPGGVVVGELTHELTRHAVAYDKLGPLAVKGKKEPVGAWLARAAAESRSRTGLRTTGKLDTPFLGRDAELRALLAAFDDAAVANRARFVLVIGEPGVGKSRLVLELARALDRRPEVITWRQGRCLAYGDGSGFAALSEIVKAHAGVLDSDDVSTVEAKLEMVLPQDERRPWLRQRLRSLLGLEAAPASPDESFTAWAAFLAHVAASDTTVLVLEDLHWASETMLAFVGHLAAQELEAPILVVATTRPELLDRHPDVLAPGKRVTRRALTSLGPEDAERLVSALADERLAAEARTPIVERVGGNPLFAEEYVRLLFDKGLLCDREGALRLKEGAELPLPDTVHAVLAARLDTLPAGHKALLCDAAVFGEGFWAGGVAALAGRSAGEVDAAMSLLAERQLVRPLASSALEGESEFLFWHALTRDVAYGELPQRARMRKHEQAAQWVEAKTGERTDDVAEVLAHHYVVAHDLARHLHDDAQVAALAPRAGHYLWRAATRNRAIAGEKARQQLEQALELLPADAPDRPPATFLLGEEVSWDRPKDAIPLFHEALPGLRDAGLRNEAAGCAVQLATCLMACGEDGWTALTQDALELTDEEHPTPDLVYALQELASMKAIAVDGCREAVDLADRALDAAQKLGLPAPGALGWRGAARSKLGDPRCLEDLKSAVDQARALGSTHTELFQGINYACTVHPWEGPGRALAAFQDVAQRSGRAGIEMIALSAEMNAHACLVDLGRWDEALREAERLVPLHVEAGLRIAVAQITGLKAVVLYARGLDDEAADLAGTLVPMVRSGSLHPELVAVCYAGAAYAHMLLGRTADARELLTECLEVGGWSANVENADAGMVRTALACGDAELAQRIRDQLLPLTPVHRHTLTSYDAFLAEARGELEAAAAGFADAAARWHEFGVPFEDGQALLGQGRCLMALGRAPEAAPVLEAAREIFARLGARPALHETEDLIAGITLR